MGADKILDMKHLVEADKCARELYDYVGIILNSSLFCAVSSYVADVFTSFNALQLLNIESIYGEDSMRKRRGIQNK